MDDYQKDFVLGNIKARERMFARCAIAGARRGAVIGTGSSRRIAHGLFHDVRRWGDQRRFYISTRHKRSLLIETPAVNAGMVTAASPLRAAVKPGPSPLEWA